MIHGRAPRIPPDRPSCPNCGAHAPTAPSAIHPGREQSPGVLRSIPRRVQSSAWQRAETPILFEDSLREEVRDGRGEGRSDNQQGRSSSPPRRIEA